MKRRADRSRQLDRGERTWSRHRVDGPASGAERRPEPLPSSIGEYRIVAKLGEGGMGVVYDAEQQHPKRRVALKVVRGGRYVDDRTLRMFQREVNTLARLRHPNIAAIYESGRNEEGCHWFAMELVRGRTLEAYLLRRPAATTLSEIRFRLGLFRKIADAVHYAHQRGVIHRDLKPSNIIVTYDRPAAGDATASSVRLPEIKILDFGLARIIEGDVNEASTVTEAGVIKGSFPYMSPEQARGHPEEIDTRSDVYSLGVILYEMLCGARPYDAVRSSVVDAVRVICEEPPRPLIRFWKPMRRIDPDIQTLVGMALEKEADRRYASAAALSEDVERYLTSQPILARPPSAIYQLRKFARRNRVLIGGVVATLIVLLAGSVVSTVLGLREAVQRREAEVRRQEAVWRSYVANVAAAASGLRLLEIGEAKRRLALCPPELRGWEWFHLQGRVDRSVATLAGAGAPLSAIAFDAVGARIAAGSEDGRLRLWDVDARRELLSLEAHSGPVRAVAFAPHRRWVASASSDKTVRLWDAASGELRATFTGSDRALTSVAVNPDGSRVVAGSRDSTIRVWDVASGTLVRVLRGHAGPVTALSFGPRGSRIVSASVDGSVRVWDAASGTERRRRATDEALWAVALSADGRRVAAGSAEGNLWLWELDGRPPRIVGRHDDAIRSVSFAPDGNQLATGSWDKTVRVWDTRTGTLLAKLVGHENRVGAVAFHPGGRGVASGAADGTLKLWRPVEPGPPGVLEAHAAAVSSVAFGPGGTRLATGSWDRTARVWELESAVPPLTLAGHRHYVSAVAFSPDGGRLATGSFDRTVRLWDATTGALEATLEGHHEPVPAVAFARSGDVLVTGSYDRTARIWDARSGETLHILREHEGPVAAVAISPDGSRVASAVARVPFHGAGQTPATVRLWSTATGDLVAELTGHEGDVYGLAFDPNGSTLASASADTTVRIWDLSSSRPVRRLIGHESDVTSVTFSPDGRRLTTGSLRGAVRLWHVDSGEHLLTLVRADAKCHSVTFSPDGSTIAAAFQDGRVRTWRSDGGPSRGIALIR